MDEENQINEQVQEVYNRVLLEIRTALKKKLDEPGQTQSTVADLCGVTQPAINRILKGTRGADLPFISILKLAIALGIDPTILYLSSNQKQEQLKAIISQISKMIVNE